MGWPRGGGIGRMGGVSRQEKCGVSITMDGVTMSGSMGRMSGVSRQMRGGVSRVRDGVTRKGGMSRHEKCKVSRAMD